MMFSLPGEGDGAGLAVSGTLAEVEKNAAFWVNESADIWFDGKEDIYTFLISVFFYNTIV